LLLFLINFFISYGWQTNNWIRLWGFTSVFSSFVVVVVSAVGVVIEEEEVEEEEEEENSSCISHLEELVAVIRLIVFSSSIFWVSFCWCYCCCC
jgi:Na+-transporting methylmalonyl-CoA/oxaloacetate decarboxylase gamma subunit